MSAVSQAFDKWVKLPNFLGAPPATIPVAFEAGFAAGCARSQDDIASSYDDLAVKHKALESMQRQLAKDREGLTQHVKDLVEIELERIDLATATLALPFASDDVRAAASAVLLAALQPPKTAP